MAVLAGLAGVPASAGDEPEDAGRSVVAAPLVWSVIGSPVFPVRGTDERIRPSSLHSVGLPFVFDRMRLQGRGVGSSLEEIDDVRFAGGAPLVDDTITGPRTRQMPLTLDVFGFR